MPNWIPNRWPTLSTWLPSTLLGIGAGWALPRRLCAARGGDLVDHLPEALWVAQDGRLQRVNPACVRLFGAASAAQLLGRPLTDLLEGADAALDASRRQADGARRTDVRIRRLDGSVGDAELVALRLPGEGAVLGSMRDIGARKQAEALFADAQASLLEAQRLARLGYFHYDVPARRWTLAPSMLDVLGDSQGRSLRYGMALDVVHADDRLALRRRLRQAIAGAGAGADADAQADAPFDFECRVVRAEDGQVRWLQGQVQTKLDALGQVARIFGSVQDVTERKLALTALEASHEELRHLSARLTQAREEERRQVARELHDELGQRLSALKLDLSALETQAWRPEAAANGPLGPALRPLLHPLLSALDDAVAATRRMACDLRPPMLDDLGLPAAIEWLVADWRKRSQLRIAFICELQADALDEAAATAIFRIVQEALANVSRHAQAAHVRIVLGCDGSRLHLTVEDDGIGLPQGEVRRADASGLADIRERVRRLGGWTSLSSPAGGGCRLEVDLPPQGVPTTAPGREAAA